MSTARADILVLSCEHAGNTVPARYRSLFASHTEALESHRGWDPGALPLARALARAWKIPLLHTDITRLLVEPNRSPHHPSLFSEFSRVLSPDDQRRVIERYYTPHRSAVREAVAREVARGRRVVHVGVHTFTPILNGDVRRTDVGLLYDPKRSAERAFCTQWSNALRAADPELRIRRNYPYHGASDGLTTWLRREFSARAYLGIELEVNQSVATSSNAAVRNDIARHIAATIPSY